MFLATALHSLRTLFFYWNLCLVAFNLVRNYSPHLAPDTAPTPELQEILGLAAREMLMEFLRKSKTRRSVAKGKDMGSTGDPLDIVSLRKLKS